MSIIPVLNPVQAPSPPWWRKWLIHLGIYLAILLGLAALIIGGLIWRARPQRDGRILMAGLRAPVTIQRDKLGVAHITASHLHDLLFAQGYAMAQDRLFQMDLLRRFAEGKLAAVFGPRVLPIDRRLRQLRLGAMAQQAMRHLPNADGRALQDFSDGVNAFINGNLSHLPLEFTLLRYRPAPWTDADSLAIDASMFMQMTNDYHRELAYAAILRKLGPKLTAQIFPTRSRLDFYPGQELPTAKASAMLPAGNVFDPRRSAIQPGLSMLSALSAFLQPPSFQRSGSTGSNNWVLARSRSTNGQPILANDPHLRYQVPGVWWTVDLRLRPAASARPAAVAAKPHTRQKSPRARPSHPAMRTAVSQPVRISSQPRIHSFHVAGAALAGIPGVIIGHNRHIAWGMTNLGAEAQQVYRYQLRIPGQPRLAPGDWKMLARGRAPADLKAALANANLPQIKRASGWRPLRYHIAKISVAGHAQVRQLIWLTPRGPVVGAADHRLLALDWTLYAPGALDAVGAFLHLDSAHDWKHFQSALARFPGPAMNFVYADRQGNIGYQAAGWLPVRGHGRGWRPQSGARRGVGWRGWIPFQHLPAVYNPASGMIVTANNRIVPPGYRYPLSHQWEAPFRVHRIARLLSRKPRWPPGQMSEIQMDIHSRPDAKLAQYLVAAAGRAEAGGWHAAPNLARALKILAAFHGDMTPHAIAPTLTWLTARNLLQMVLSARLGARLAMRYRWSESPLVWLRWLREAPAQWLPGKYQALARARGARAAWDQLTLDALARVTGASRLKAARWRWGRFNRFFVPHPFYDHFWLLRDRADFGPRGVAGGRWTVKANMHGIGPSMRFTADLAHWNRSTLTLFSGESGEPFSPHYRDQYPAWLAGRGEPLWFTRAAVAAHLRHTLVLYP